MEVDWDLQAVVRGCTFASADPPPSSINQTDEEILSSAHFGFASDCFFTNNTLDQLFHFHPTTNHHAPPPPLHHPQPREDLFDELYFPAPAEPRVVSLSPTPVEPKREIPKPALHPATPLRSKRRRKSQIKKVCEVPAEGLSSDDTWSWRKYGQKPIKGSPYPRGYYRCSSSKGCPARKQLERNRSDPDMFIVTYTAEHNHPAPTHRNSLAGTTRHHHKRNILPITTNQQQDAPKPTTTSSSSVPTSTSPSDDDADVQQSTKTAENQFDGMDDGGLFLLDDGFFDGLDGEIAGDGCCWFANSTTRS